jgi:hypothetical protein
MHGYDAFDCNFFESLSLRQAQSARLFPYMLLLLLLLLAVTAIKFHFPPPPAPAPMPPPPPQMHTLHPAL